MWHGVSWIYRDPRAVKISGLYQVSIYGKSKPRILGFDACLLACLLVVICVDFKTLGESCWLSKT
jgi:hypothetical protein